MALGDGKAALARARAQRAARRAVAPGRLSRLFVRRPKLACLAAACVPLLAVGVLAAARALRLSDPTFRDYLIRDDERVRVDDARNAARDELELDDALAFVAGGGDAAARDGDAERSVRVAEMRLSLLFRAPGPDGVDDVVDDAADAAKGANMLTREAVAAMKRVEDLVVDDPPYEEFCFRDEDARDCAGDVPRCALRQSITTHPKLYGEVDSTGRVCGIKSGSDLVSEQDFADFLDAISVDALPGNGERAIDLDYSFLLGVEANATEVPKTFITRSVFQFGTPFPGYTSSDEDRAEQREEYTSWLIERVPEWEEDAREGETPLNVIASGLAYGNALFGSIASRDLSFAIAAIILVLLFMWLHTSSLFLAGAAMLQVVLAFPLAYFFYYFVFQIKYFSSLQIMCIFLILGIAADDAFVFVDAWKQSSVVLGIDCDLVRRMSWTYRRAVKAMAVTSFTTALAFGFTAVSPVMPVGTLGYWAALLVLMQYLLVITMYPCAVVIWHRSLRVRSIRNCFKAPEEDPVLITAEDDEAAAANDSGDLDPNDQLAVTKAAIGDVSEESGGEEDAEAGVSAVEAKDQEGKNADAAEEGRKASKHSWKSFFSQSENEYRPVERFFRYQWTNWIQKLRYVLIVVIVGLYATSIYLATRLEPLSETEAFLEEDHPVEIALRFQSEAFPSNGDDKLIQVAVFWGAAGIDRDGTSRYDPEAIGSPVFDKTFDLKPAASQDFLLRTCETLEANKELVARFNADAAECWIRDFQEWRSFNKSEDAFETYDSDAALVDDLRAFLGFADEASGQRPYVKYAEDEAIGFARDGGSVVYTELVFDTDVANEAPHRVAWPFYERWQAEVDKLAADAPGGVGRPLVTGGYAFMWAVTTQTLIRNAFIGIGIMLGVAALVLAVSTANAVVALFATVAIGGIVCNLLALLFVWGYEMGLTESVSVIIAAGVSFDFCSHIANAYTESRHGDRFNRTRDALTDLGISVLAGGVSTMVAVAVLFFATITFFQKFARSLVSTVALSLVWSLALLVAMLLVAGPQEGFGSLKPAFRRILGCVPCVRKTAAEGESQRV